MKFRDWALLLAGAGAAALVYGALYESKRLVVRRITISLPNWPERLDGYRIALMADFHLRDVYSLELAQHAILKTLEEDPDMVVLAGDFVGYWKPQSEAMLEDVLTPMLLLNGDVVAVPGNHDYWLGTPDRLLPVMNRCNIKLLRNETWVHHGINWVGIDSACYGHAKASRAIEGVGSGPRIVLWHEPDPVEELPFDADLQLSGHSHGGQWRFPGWTPMHTRLGERYVDGYYPREGSTPIFVTTGVGTTGPPARMMCPPEVAILTLRSKA